MIHEIRKLLTNVLIRPHAYIVKVINDTVQTLRKPHVFFRVPRELQTSSEENGTVKTGRLVTRMKPMYKIEVRRNGDVVYRFKRTRDLFVWRGQTVFAYLLSQGVIGSVTSEWYLVVSENDTSPDMGDDSDDPLVNEFNPVVGEPVKVSWLFNPNMKVSGGYQTFATLELYGTVTANNNATVRKIGIIDKKPTDMYRLGVRRWLDYDFQDNVTHTNHSNIIVEDLVVPFDVVSGDQINVHYFIQLG